MDLYLYTTQQTYGSNFFSLLRIKINPKFEGYGVAATYYKYTRVKFTLETEFLHSQLMVLSVIIIKYSAYI